MKRITEEHHGDMPDLPEGYFEDLEDRVLERWYATDRGSLIRTISRLIPVTAVAASIAVILMFASGPASWEDRLTEEELAYYYLYTDGMQDVWYDLGDIEEDELVDWLVSEEADLELLEDMY